MAATTAVIEATILASKVAVTSAVMASVLATTTALIKAMIALVLATMVAATIALMASVLAAMPPPLDPHSAIVNIIGNQMWQKLKDVVLRMKKINKE